MGQQTQDIQTPKPGDVVVVETQEAADRLSLVKLGQRAVIDSHWFGEDGEALICFAASAFRPLDGSHVSCSGGPVPLVKLSDLVPAGEGEQRFWHWMDRPRAGGGVEYVETVNVWSVVR